MKYILSFLFLVIILQSCQNDLKAKTAYYENDKIKSVEYINSKNLIEKKIFYSIKGNKNSEIFFKNGKENKSFLYNEEGELMSKFIFGKDNFCTEVKCDEKGITGKGKYNKNWSQVGIWEYFDENDKLVYKIKFHSSETK